MQTYVEVDIDKIKENIRNISSIDPDANFCAVVKANAYGLGSATISKEIEDMVDYFAVSRINEALVLRKVGIVKPILILGYVSYSEIDTCADYNIEVPVYDLEYVRNLDDKLRESGKRIKAHIAIDTGHTRIGFREFEIDDILQLKKLTNIDIKSTFTHYSTADEADTSFTDLQTQKFYNMVDKLYPSFNFEFVHIANSAGAIKHKRLKDMARIGISLYGIYPSEQVKDENHITLAQCFELKSEVSFVKMVDAGTPVSYGKTYITDKTMQIATIPIGYADGYPRSLSNKGEVYINGKLCRVLGRVCMDQMMVDVTGIDVKIGDEVTIYPDIYKEALKIETIVYELMTSINIRVPRVYKKNGKIFSIEDYLGEIYED